MKLQRIKNLQQGFSLIEVMIGLVLGLIATIVITNVFSSYEKQKRTTTGTANAQTNGSIALYQLTKDIKSAGFGLPMFMQSSTPLRCYENATKVSAPASSAEGLKVDHDLKNATPEIGLSPVIIVNGAAGASDTIAVRFGNSSLAGAGAEVEDYTDKSKPRLKTTLACRNEKAGVANYALIMSNSGVNSFTNVCEFVGVKQRNGNQLVFDRVPAVTMDDSTLISCLGEWSEHLFAVDNDQLTVTGTRKTAAGGVDATPVDLVPEIVSLQAQYGVSTIDDNNKLRDVDPWVDAEGNEWGATMSVDNRNRIKAIRVAVVARSGQREQQPVSQDCDGGAAGLAKVCIWQQDATPQNVDLTAKADWQNYRYRVYETVIPLRNVLMNKISLCEGQGRSGC